MSTTTEKTTETPWAINHALTADVANEIVDVDGMLIAECPRYGAGIVSDGRTAPWHHADANAALIVTAVNNHARLKAFAQSVITQAEGDLSDHDFRAYIHKLALEASL